MKSYHLYISLVVFALGVFHSCKKQAAPPSFHYDYFELTPGHFVEYDVMEIEHDITQFIKHDTNRYQLRTVIGDTVIDNEGRIARKFIRYKRANASASWVLSDVWTTIISGNRAELVEENQRVIKLVFAPTLSKEWNVNAFNMDPEMNAYYSKLHKKRQVGNITYDSTLVVELEVNEPNYVEYKRKYEVYAKGVGLVYKSYKDIKIEPFDTLSVTKGSESFYTCINFGVQ